MQLHVQWATRLVKTILHDFVTTTCSSSSCTTVVAVAVISEKSLLTGSYSPGRPGLGAKDPLATLCGWTAASEAVRTGNDTNRGWW